MFRWTFLIFCSVVIQKELGFSTFVALYRLSLFLFQLTLVCPYILSHVGLEIQFISWLNGPLQESSFPILNWLKLSWESIKGFSWLIEVNWEQCRDYRNIVLLELKLGLLLNSNNNITTHQDLRFVMVCQH